MNKSEISEAIFGSFDGLVSVMGIIFGLLSQGETTILLAAIGLAVASAIGMGAGEYLGDTEAHGAIRRAFIMAMATAVGTLVPTAPFLFFHKTPAVILAGIFTLFLATIIGIVRNKGARGYIETYSILIAAATITVLVSLVIPASAGG